MSSRIAQLSMTGVALVKTEPASNAPARGLRGRNQGLSRKFRSHLRPSRLVISSTSIIPSPRPRSRI